jgi:hypothetical protein
VSSTGARILRILEYIAITLALMTFGLAYLEGMLPNALFVLLLIAAPLAVLGRLGAAFGRRLEYGMLRHPLSREMRPYVLQLLNRSLFWGMAAAALAVALGPAQFEPGEYQAIWILIGAAILVLIPVQLVPPRGVLRRRNFLHAVGWIFLGWQCTRILLPIDAGEPVVLDPPFRGEWCVFQGGRSGLINHHFVVPSQRDALDLLALRAGRTVLGDPGKLESYPSFEQPLFAPAAGRVVHVLDGRPDMTIGTTDLEEIAGNYVIIDMGRDRYVLLAHMQRGSIAVSEGQQVQPGQFLGRCGNSGNTSCPHLHLQVQNRPVWNDSAIRTFSMTFRGVTRIRWGRRSAGTVGDFRRNDRILVTTDVPNRRRD